MKDHVAFFNQGNAFYNAKKYDLAVQSYKQAIQLNPDYEIAHYFLGLAYMALENFEEATGAFKQAIQLNESDKDSHFNLGLVYLELGSTVEAKYHIKRALDLGHEQAQTVLESIPSQEQLKSNTKPKLSRFENHFNKANILLDKGKIKEAVFLFKEAIPNEPNADPNTYLPKSFLNPGYVHFCLGLQHEKNGNLKKAGYHLVLAVQIGNAPAKAVYEWMNRSDDLPKPKSKQINHTTLFNEAVGLQNDGKYKDAIKAFKEFIDRKPNYALAHYFLGECYVEMGQSANAILAFREALSIEEQDQWTHFKLGLEYKKERNISKAKLHLERALNLGYEPAKEELDNLPREPMRRLITGQKNPEQPLIRTLSGHTDSVQACAISPDGSFVVSAAGNMMKIYGHDNDNTLRVWDFKTGVERLKLSGHLETVKACAISKDDLLIISVSEDCMKVWDAATGKELNHIETSGFACSECTDDTSIVVASLFVELIDIHSGKEKITILIDDLLHDCAISKDSSFIVTAGTDRHLAVWNAKNGEEIKYLKTPNNTNPYMDIRACSISPNDKFIVSGDEEGILRIWDTKSFEEIRVIKGHSNWITACAVSPDNEMIVSSSWDGTLKIWEVVTGKNILALTGHTGAINDCAFSACGKYIISAGDDKTVKIWDFLTFKSA